jgi:hypothetical protein
MIEKKSNILKEKSVWLKIDFSRYWELNFTSKMWLTSSFQIKSITFLLFFLLFYSFQMSRVPMMFRDWWDDWETPSRASRVIDSHFGSGLRWFDKNNYCLCHFLYNAFLFDFMSRRDDLLSSWAGAASPSSLRGGYYRPWKNTAMQRQDSGSTINSDKEKFQVRKGIFYN